MLVELLNGCVVKVMRGCVMDTSIGCVMSIIGISRVCHE